MKLTKLIVNMNEETTSELQRVRHMKGLSLTETIRRCIAIYCFFVDEQAAGRKVFTQDEDGRNRREMVSL